MIWLVDQTLALWAAYVPDWWTSLMPDLTSEPNRCLESCAVHLIDWPVACMMWLVNRTAERGAYWGGGRGGCPITWLRDQFDAWSDWWNRQIQVTWWARISHCLIGWFYPRSDWWMRCVKAPLIGGWEVGNPKCVTSGGSCRPFHWREICPYFSGKS